MDNEQLDRRIEFIIEQQAQFAVDIQQLKAVQAELTNQHNHLTGALTTVVSIVGDLAVSQDQLTQQVEKLAKSQTETHDRLDVLIGVVERYFSGNGRPSKSKSRTSKPALKRGTRKSSRKK